MEGKTKIHRLICNIKCNSSKRYKIIKKTIKIKVSRQLREKSIKKIQSKNIKYVRGCLSTCYRISRIVYKQDGTRVHNNKRTVGRIPRWKKTSFTVLYLQMLVLLSYKCIFSDDIIDLNTSNYNCVWSPISIKIKGMYCEKARGKNSGKKFQNSKKWSPISIKLKGMYWEKARGKISGKKFQNSKKCTAMKNNILCNIISENLLTDSIIIQNKNSSVFRFNSSGERSYGYHCLNYIILIYIQNVHMGHRIGFFNIHDVE